MPPEITATPYEVLSQVINLTNEDERNWWHSTAPIFARMMSLAQYDVHLQYKYLCLHRELVIPELGPYPRPGHPRWKSFLTAFGVPFELSLNCSKSLVRFGFEPIGDLTGTGADLLNTQKIRDTVTKLARYVPNLDLQWFDHFTRELVPSQEEAAWVLNSNPKNLVAAKTQQLLALDLANDDSEILAKAYFYPQLKALTTGISSENIVFDAIHKIDHDGALSGPIAVLKEYLATRGAHDRIPGAGDNNPSLSPFFLSIDLADPAKSRIKCYLAEEEVTFKTVEDIWTLGGRRTDSGAISGLNDLKTLWELLKLPEGRRNTPDEVYDIGQWPKEQRLPLLIHFALCQGHQFPEPQIYFPGVGKSDLEIADALVAFFDRKGWVNMAQGYKRSLSLY